MRGKVYPDRNGAFVIDKETLDHTTTEFRVKDYLPRLDKTEPLNLRLFYSPPLFGPSQEPPNAPNDEVERRGSALPPNEAYLSRSSTPSLAHRRRNPAIARTDC
jgi:hypothetical protein